MINVSRLLLPFGILLALPVPAPAAPVAAPDVAGLKVEPGGAFTLDRIAVYAGHFDRDWRQVAQLRARPAPGYPRREGSAWSTRILLQVAGASAPITLDERLEKTDAASFRLHLAATHPTGVPTQEMFLQLKLPVEVAAGKAILIDGAKVELPVAFGETSLYTGRSAASHSLVLPGATGTVTVEGAFSLLVQDNRKWKQDSYSVRLRFSPGGDTLTKADLSATFRFTPYRSTPISLRDAANFGFRDEVAGDGRGGWTDQGAANDLRMLPAGSLKAANVVFDILDADANGGRAAIVLGKADQSFLPKSVQVSVPPSLTGEAAGWRNLYLLHATGWTPPDGKPIGRVVLRHADGSETSSEIVSGRDVGNWWSPRALPNAAVGWDASNPSGDVGLYVSRIPLDGKPVNAIRLESAGTAMWMIAGISGADGDIVPASLPPKPWIAAAGPQWSAYDNQIDIEPGSVFDFSGSLDAPAGKYGRLIATPEGHFAFEKTPGKRARFWGVNLTFSSNILSNDTADRLADQLARSGYNTVRFHHFEREIQSKGDNSSVLEAAKIDRMDYLFSALKKRGLYLNIDLYVDRILSPLEMSAIGFDPASAPLSSSRFKAAVPVSDAAFRIWSEYARSFLTHPNPYTGLTWGEDPALIGICLINEDSPSDLVENDPVLAPLWQKAFAAWRAKPENLRKNGETDTAYFNRFVFEKQADCERRMAEFVRDLGVKTLLTGTNHQMSQGLAFVRQGYDYVDNHQYWDHPRFPEKAWSLPTEFRQLSPTRYAAQMPRSLMPTRILGKPFAVTEFNFVRPNRHRAEGGVLMPAYAGLQDWDALYNFEYAGSSRSFVPGLIGGGGFSLVNDPIGLIADRVSAAIFLRGDVEPAKSEIGFAVQADAAFLSRNRGFPDAFSKIGLVTRIGSRFASPAELLKDRSLSAVVCEPSALKTANDPRLFAADDTLAAKLQSAGALPPGSVSADGNRYRSETGQIELQADVGTVKLVTPRSELFALPPKASLAGDRMTVRNGETGCSVAVVAVDGRPLAESRRLLVTHLTDAVPTGAQFADQNRRLEKAHGTLPLLIERGSAELTLKLAADGEYQAWAVSSTGARLREVPLEKTASGWVLQAVTVTENGAQLAYEIARK